MESGSVLLSRAVSSQVPSALKGLTSVFGMGTGGSLSLSPPELSRVCTLKTAHPALKHLVPVTFLMAFGSSPRPISNDNLHALPRFQRRPIYLLVFQGSHGNLILVVGFTLRCFQRLSRPYFASQLCPWQDNCCTSGTSTPVLSY